MLTIHEVINNYFHSYLNAEAEHLLDSFHPDTRLYSVDEGKLDRTEMADWLENLRQRKSEGDLRKAELEIVSIDKTNDAAVAKIKIKFATLEFTDFLSLLNYAGGWKVVGKIYSVTQSPVS